MNGHFLAVEHDRPLRHMLRTGFPVLFDPSRTTGESRTMWTGAPGYSEIKIEVKGCCKKVVYWYEGDAKKHSRVNHWYLEYIMYKYKIILGSLLLVLAVFGCSEGAEKKDSGTTEGGKVVSAIVSNEDLEGTTWASSCTVFDGENVRYTTTFSGEKATFYEIFYADEECSKPAGFESYTDTYKLGSLIDSVEGDKVYEINYTDDAGIKYYGVIALDKSVSPPVLIFTDPDYGDLEEGPEKRANKLWKDPSGMRVLDNDFEFPKE